MKQLRFTTTKPMAMLGILNPKEDHKILVTPNKIGEFINDKIIGKTAYIHGIAEGLAGFDIPDFIDGNLGQLDLPFNQQDILMLLPSGEYKCKAEHCMERGATNSYLITLVSEPFALVKNQKQKYIRLLNYDNACKVVEFINKNDKADYANITTGGVSMQVAAPNWDKVYAFINSLGVRYEIGTEAPHRVEKQIVNYLKKTGVIKKNPLREKRTN